MKCTTQFECQKTECCHLVSTVTVFLSHPSLCLILIIFYRYLFPYILLQAHLMYSNFEVVKCTSNERICAHLLTVLTMHKRHRFPECEKLWRRRFFYTWMRCNETFHMHSPKYGRKNSFEVVLTICLSPAILECTFREKFIRFFCSSREKCTFVTFSMHSVEFHDEIMPKN